MSNDLAKKGIIILGVAGVSFSAILVKYADAPSMVLVFYRMLLASLILTIPGSIQLAKERKNISLRDGLCCLVSGVFLALHFTAYFESIRFTSIASAVILVDTEVFFVAFAMRIFFREKISRKGWAGIFVTFIGSVVVALGDVGGGSDILRGDLIALSGAFLIAVSTIMGRQCRTHMSTSLYTMIVYWISVITTVVILSLRRVPLFGYGKKEILIGLGMAILCTLLGHNIYNWGLRYIRASFIATAKLMEPVFASILGILFFRQFPSWTAIVGGIIIIFGIYYYSIQNE